MADPTLESILHRYGWFDHPEGMKFVETHRDAYRSVGHWLFVPDSHSAFHRVTNCEEIWAIHAGRLTLHVLDPAGGYQRYRLGLDLASGERPVVAVPRRSWQAAELPAGEPLAFGTNVCAPAFQYSVFELGKRDAMLASFPEHADIIGRLSRPAE